MQQDPSIFSNVRDEWFVHAMNWLSWFAYGSIAIVAAHGIFGRKNRRLAFAMSLGGGAWAFWCRHIITQDGTRDIGSFGGVWLVITLSSMLFYIKVNSPLLYGSIELAFAFVSACISTMTLKEDKVTATIILASSVYLMVRAFDNIKKGLDERKKIAK
jgi:hypothetical protein